MSGGFVFSEKPIRIVEGSGTTLVDDAGTRYLDAGASYACVPLGHGHPRVTDAVTTQLQELTYVHGSYPSPARDRLMAKLVALAPGDLDGVWLCNSGAEAIEAALKFARHATGESTIVAAKRGFHGRTMGALSATWKSQYRSGYEPLVDGFEFVDYGDIDALEAVVDEDTAAVILEPIQGEGGINPASTTYLEAARDVTAATGAALIFDEIQTGLGRTGSFWACTDHGVVPDILTTAKGLANGLPIGATLCRDWVADDHGNHGSTFSGGPLVTAAATATLDVLTEDDVPANATAIGTELRDAIEDRVGDDLRDVRGKGLLIGLEVKRGVTRVARQLAVDEQILALPAGRTVLRLVPPLVIGPDDAAAIVDGVDAVVGSESTE